MTATSDPFAQEDEVDLAEIFLGLWSQKTLVGFVTFTCLVASVIYALRATPTYESISVFEISGEQSQPRFSSDFGGLANLAAFGIRDGNQNLGVFDRLQGRNFVLGVATELALDQDPYFNPLSSEDRGKSFLGGLKGVIKTLLAPSPGDGSVGEEPLARNAIVEKFTKVKPKMALSG
jgi:uncharacterized protein involved in exopolysaccharide biosynthesis